MSESGTTPADRSVDERASEDVKNTVPAAGPATCPVIPADDETEGRAASSADTPGSHPEVTATITLGLIGMTCASCAMVIEKTLGKVPGV
ncbi:MAG: cation transporter, partial [Actinomycetia bacterium]|nr:cation transporter [Actinomycetes bacterium]